MTDVRIERTWADGTVVYTLRSPLGDLTLDSRALNALGEQAKEFQQEEHRFIAESRAATHPPTRFGLTQARPTSDRITDAIYQRPDPALDDPIVAWSHGVRSAGEWYLVLPLNLPGNVRGEPVATAAWDDPDGIEHLCSLAKDPKATWTLFGLAHPDLIQAHLDKSAADAAKQVAREVRDTNIAANIAAWNQIGPGTVVDRKAVRETLEAAFGKSLFQQRVFLKMTALPLDPEVLLRDPETIERTGFAAESISARHLVGGHKKTSNQYPAAGWLLSLAPYATSKADPYAKVPTWQATAHNAIQIAGLGHLVARPDGVWIVRDERVFDLLHAQWDASDCYEEMF